ncbi:DEKNAAC100279 [Brettanomyces naardenensis]|uniref:Biogenesis of lysosome-related organelles complex 1 subunit CNL1 n=1 Tax=Brettanomyces naardenensis TaxID=13370 RepID=A0A448YGM7_BRENA|nr:DEKNAAC100279 [Brettanomyces naardenensis]
MSKADDQSSQATLGTNDSTIGPTSLTDYVILDHAGSADDAPNASEDSKSAGENNQNSTHQETDDDEEEEDPLQVRRLALTFDYLMYKIQDHTTVLSEAVAQNVDYTKKQQEFEISQVNRRIKEARKIINECNRTDLEIDKLEQLQLMTRDFRDRLASLDTRLKRHNKTYGR